MVTLFLGLGLQKSTLDTNTATAPGKYVFCDGQNISTIVTADSNNLLAVMRQVLEEIHNKKHIIREHISSLSELDIRTAH